MSNTTKSLQEIIDRTPFLRGRILKMVNAAGAGHPGGSLSVIDLLSTLMLGWGHFSPDNTIKDWLVLGKGHAVPALYALLIELGYLDENELFTYRKLGSRLQGHPDRRKLPFVQVSTGHLGQGLSIGVGLAIGEKIKQSGRYVYVILGDGDLNEGQTWEAIQSASHYKLGNLIILIDSNGLTQHGPTTQIMNIEPIANKFKSFGWIFIEVDGHNHKEVLNALKKVSKSNKPAIINCLTVKGKGISFMENEMTWHSRDLPDDLLEKSLIELRLK
jgi:transketolase